MVSAGLLSAFKGKDPVSEALPGEWNKDWFHFVNINIATPKVNRPYPGYIWATDNWVEAHCFSNVKVRKVWKILDEDHHISTWENIGEAYVPLPSQGVLLQANKGFVFSDRILSFIAPRDAVSYSSSNRAKFYSHLFKFRDSIDCSPSADDMDRWYQWHPTDDYKMVFSGSTVLGHYFGTYHGGDLYICELGDGQIYPISGSVDSGFLTYN